MIAPATEAGRNLMGTHTGAGTERLDGGGYLGWVENSYEDTLTFIHAIERQAADAERELIRAAVLKLYHDCIRDVLDMLETRRV